MLTENCLNPLAAGGLRQSHDRRGSLPGFPRRWSFMKARNFQTVVENAVITMR
jgi:hypothetical protein